MAIQYAHIFFSGFTQRVGRKTNGIHRLFDRVYQQYAGPETLVEWFPWYASPRDVAGRLLDLQHGLRARGTCLAVQLVGYSFGGQTAVRVAEYYGPSQIALLDLCDPVARLGRFGWLRAANPFAGIRVPSNVRDVLWIRQRNPRWQCRRPYFHPSGHRLRLDFSTELDGPVDLTAYHGHDTIDNSTAFRCRVLQRAAGLHGDEGPEPIAARIVPCQGKAA